jgi:hypothetical protein
MGIVSLLTCKRLFPLEEAGRTIPSNMFWGTAELRDRGVEVVEVVPAHLLKKSAPLRFLRRIAGGCAVHVYALLSNRALIRQHGKLFTISGVYEDEAVSQPLMVAIVHRCRVLGWV